MLKAARILVLWIIIIINFFILFTRTLTTECFKMTHRVAGLLSLQAAAFRQHIQLPVSHWEISAFWIWISAAYFSITAFFYVLCFDPFFKCNIMALAIFGFLSCCFVFVLLTCRLRLSSQRLPPVWFCPQTTNINTIRFLF